MRKNSIAKYGLFDTSFIHTDLEYITRITFNQAVIAWNTALLAIAIKNEKSNSVISSLDFLNKEKDRINNRYNKKIDQAVALENYPILKLYKTICKKIIYKLFKIDLLYSKNKSLCETNYSNVESIKKITQDDYNITIEELFNSCSNLILSYNKNSKSKIVL
jgi:hypothetical protein